MELYENVAYLIYVRNGMLNSKLLVQFGKAFLNGIVFSLCCLTAIPKKFWNFDV